MRKLFRIFAMSLAVSVLTLSVSTAFAEEKKDAAKAAAPAAAAPAKKERKDFTGKELAFDRSIGNCLACHMIEGGDLPGNIGPPLVGMAAGRGAVADPGRCAPRPDAAHARLLGGLRDGVFHVLDDAGVLL
ncbi:MAG: hypothetical protein ACK4RS_06460, partial [Thiothrix sp.]